MSLDFKPLITQYMVSVESNLPMVSELASGIVQDKFTFLEFIQSLGSYLTEDKETIRAKASELVCDVLGQLPANKLSIKECYYLVAFLINRLDDDFKSSMPGLESLIRMDNFNSTELVEQLVQKIEADYQPRQLLAKHRYAVFKVLSELLLKFENFLLSKNDLFIKAFIKVSTGEKDPRNLLISFDLNYKISTTFQIDSYSEDLFDNSFCYFPISFKPPANDPYKISSEQLKQALRRVLSCNSRFAKDCIPNLIEKLSSTSSMVKLDSLYTLIDCIENYSDSTVKEYSISIWNSLKYEVLHNELQNLQNYDDFINKYVKSNIEEDHVLPATLALFQKLFLKLTNHQDHEELEQHMTVDLMIEELLGNLKPLDNQKAKQSLLILSFLASTSVSNYNLIIAKVFPLLLESDSLSIALQRLFITYSQFFLDSYSELFLSGKTPSGIHLINYKDELFVQFSKSLMSSSTSEVSLRCLAIEALTKLIKLPQFLEQQELNLIVQYFTEVLLTDDNPNTSSKVMSSIVEISGKYPNSVLEITVPRLLILLPDSDTNDKLIEVKSLNSKEKVLEVISKIVENKQILDVILVRLLNKISVLISGDNFSVDYLKLLVVKMIEILEKTRSKTLEADQVLVLDDYLSKFVPQFLYLILNHELLTTDDSLLEVCSKLIKLIVVNTSASQHQRLVDSLVNIFIKGNTSDVLLTQPIQSPIKLLENPNKLVTLFVKIVSAVDKSATQLNDIDVEDYITQLILICQLDSLIKLPYLRLGYLLNLSLVVNKYLKPSQFLESKLSELHTPDNKAANVTFLKNLEIITWTTKALILKDDPLAEKSVNHIIELLSNEDPIVSNAVCKSVEILAAKCELFEGYTKAVEIFGKKKQVVFNLDIKPLYKQKFYNSIIPKLIDSFEETDSNLLKKNYLISLSLSLKYVNEAIMSSHIKQVFPLISKSLFFDVASNIYVIKSSVNIILMSLSQDPSLVTAELKSVIPRLLELINSNAATEEIKLTSLRCLIEICDKLSLNVVMDYREGVIRNLGYALDDKKRHIRKLAADCRQLYFDLGQLKD